MGLRYGERGIKEAMVSTEFAGGAQRHPLDIQARILEEAGVEGGQELPITQVGCSSSSRLLRAQSPFSPLLSRLRITPVPTPTPTRAV